MAMKLNGEKIGSNSPVRLHGARLRAECFTSQIVDTSRWPSVPLTAKKGQSLARWIDTSLAAGWICEGPKRQAYRSNISGAIFGR
jgi:hypothetical protein